MMAEREIVVVLGADVGDLSMAMAKAQASVKKTAQTIERELSKADKKSGTSLKSIGSKFADMTDSVGKSVTKIGAISSGLTSVISTLSPVMAVAGAGVGAFAGTLVTAGVGMAGFGAVAVSTLGDVFNATDETFSQLSKSQQEAYKDLQTFKSFWGDFAKGFEGGTVSIFSDALEGLQTILTKIEPAIQGTVQGVSTLMNSLNQGLESESMTAFFDFVSRNAEPAILSLGKSIGNVFVGIANTLVAFEPLTTMFQDGMVRMTESFANWSAGLKDSNGFNSFVEYVKVNTPIVLSLFGGIISAVVNILAVLAPLGTVVITMLDGIVEAINTFSTQFREAFSAENFSGIGEAFSGLILNIITVLLESIPQLVTTGMQMMSGIILGITQSIPQIVTAVLALIQAILTNILVNFPLLISAGVQLLQGLVQGILQALPQLLTMATQIIQMFVNMFTLYLPLIMQAGMDLLLGLLQGIITALPTVIESLIVLLNTLINTIITFLTENLPLILQTGIQLLMTLVQGILTALPQFIATVQTLIPQFVAMISEMLPQIITAGIEILLALIEGIVNILPQLISTAIDLIMSVANTIIQNLPMIIQAGIQVLNALIEGILQILPQLITTAIELVSRVMDTIIQNLPMIISAGIELLVALVEGITNALPQLIAMALTLIIEIVGELLANLPMILNAGLEIIFALIDGLIQAIPDLVGAIPEIVDAIFDAFGDVEWGEIGKNIIDGIAKGIGDFAGTLISKGKEVAENALGGIKSFLGIKSPSRVFRDEVGKWIPEGIAVGIDRSEDVAINSVTDMGENMVMQKPFESLRTSLNRVPELKVINGGGNGGELTQHFHINATIREEADIRKLAKELKREEENINRAGGVVDYGIA